MPLGVTLTWYLSTLTASANMVDTRMCKVGVTSVTITLVS